MQDLCFWITRSIAFNLKSASYSFLRVSIGEGARTTREMIVKS